MPVEHSIPEEKSRRTLIILWRLLRLRLLLPSSICCWRNTATPTPPPTLAGAIRAGSPDFENTKS